MSKEIINLSLLYQCLCVASAKLMAKVIIVKGKINNSWV